VPLLSARYTREMGEILEQVYRELALVNAHLEALTGLLAQLQTLLQKSRAINPEDTGHVHVWEADTAGLADP